MNDSTTIDQGGRARSIRINDPTRDGLGATLAERLRSMASARGFELVEPSAREDCRAVIIGGPADVRAGVRSMRPVDREFLVQFRGGTSWRIRYCIVGSETTVEDTVESEVAILEAFERFLRLTQRSFESESPATSLGRLLEEFMTMWSESDVAQVMREKDREIAEGLILTIPPIIRVSSDGRPPEPLLKGVFDWFVGQLQLVIDEFSKSVGKSLGVAVAGATAAAVVGQADELLHLAHRVLAALGAS